MTVLQNQRTINTGSNFNSLRVSKRASNLSPWFFPWLKSAEKTAIHPLAKNRWELRQGFNYQFTAGLKTWI